MFLNHRAKSALVAASSMKRIATRTHIGNSNCMYYNMIRMGASEISHHYEHRLHSSSIKPTQYAKRYFSAATSPTGPGSSAFPPITPPSGSVPTPVDSSSVVDATIADSSVIDASSAVIDSVTAVASLSDVNFVVRHVMTLLESVHLWTGLPYWEAIALTTLGIRAVLLPVVIKTIQNSGIEPLYFTWILFSGLRPASFV